MFVTRERSRQLFVVILVLAVQCVGCSLGFKNLVRQRSVDFRTYYAAGRIVHAGDSALLYDYDTQRRFQNEPASADPYVLKLMEPPYTALLFYPLSIFDFRAAYFIFLVLNLLLAAISIAIMRPFLSALSGRFALGLWLLFFTFIPLCIALGQGQLSLMLVALYCGAYAALRRGTQFLAGLLVSLALLKFQIALPVILLFVLWRQWRVMAGFVTGAALLGTISISQLGLAHLGSFWHALFPSQTALHAGAIEGYAIHPERMPNIYGFTYVLSSGRHWGLVLTIICSVLLLLWAARKPPSLPLALLVASLVSYHLYLHDLTVLLLPISLLLNHHLSAQQSHSARVAEPLRATWRRQAGLASMALLLVSPVTLILMGADRIYLLALPILVLTLASGATEVDVETAAPIFREHLAPASVPA